MCPGRALDAQRLGSTLAGFDQGFKNAHPDGPAACARPDSCAPITVNVHVLTLFPRLFDAFLEESIVGIAVAQGALSVERVDYRSYARDRHRSVDDRPYGGGPGMVIKPEPVFEAVEDVLTRSGRADMPKVLFTPQGRSLDQGTAEWLAEQPDVLMLCGRYEGFDERIHKGFDWTELSLGPYVLSGGELPAMVAIEAAARLLPGVLGHLNLRSMQR